MNLGVIEGQYISFKNNITDNVKTHNVLNVKEQYYQTIITKYHFHLSLYNIK